MILPKDEANFRLYSRYISYGNGYYYNNNWSNWGRWAVLGGVIFVFLVIFFLCSCMTARRRRNQGVQPYRGTAWLAPQHGPVQYNNRPQMENQYQPPAPPYENQGYYGQQSGVELQPPSNTYQPQNNGAYGYQPPAGPPPGKRDIVA